MRGFINDIDKLNTKPISILGAIGFGLIVLFGTLILMIVSIFIIGVPFGFIENFQMVNDLVEIGIEILTYSMVISIIKKIYVNKYDDFNLEEKKGIIFKSNDYFKVFIFTIGEIIFVLGGIYFVTLIPIPEELRELLNEEIFNSFFFMIVSIGIVAPIVEEILFRGILLKGLIRKYNKKKAVIIGAIVFAFMHLPDIHNVLIILPGSIVYCFIYYYTRSIVPGIIIHMFYNIMVVCIDEFLGIFNLNNLELSGGTSFVFVLIGVLIMVLSYKKLNLRSRYDSNID